jgi:hypothetical protein
MDKPTPEQIVHGLIGSLENPPSDEVLTISYLLCDFLKAHADGRVVDTGFGFAESCLDFWVDGKGLRVVVSRTPAFDRKPENPPL